MTHDPSLWTCGPLPEPQAAVSSDPVVSVAQGVALAAAVLAPGYAVAYGLGLPVRRYRAPRLHSPRLLKRTGWIVCERDACKLRARSAEEFARLADALPCPATVADVRGR